MQLTLLSLLLVTQMGNVNSLLMKLMRSLGSWCCSSTSASMMIRSVCFYPSTLLLTLHREEIAIWCTLASMMSASVFIMALAQMPWLVSCLIFLKILSPNVLLHLWQLAYVLVSTFVGCYDECYDRSTMPFSSTALVHASNLCLRLMSMRRNIKQFSILSMRSTQMIITMQNGLIVANSGPKMACKYTVSLSFFYLCV